jgi:hypothetical protein
MDLKGVMHEDQGVLDVACFYELYTSPPVCRETHTRGSQGVVSCPSVAAGSPARSR